MVRAATIITLLALVATSLPLPASPAQADSDLCPPHPHPCGDEWPADAPAEFHVAEQIHLPIMAHDNVTIDGHVWLPNRTDVSEFPVILTSTPYPGQCLPSPSLVGSPSCMWRINATGFTTSDFWKDHRFQELIEAGYAVAIYSVRGTGASGGCFELLGPSEQHDQATLVEGLAKQPWSNGHVAMWGLSYMGTTPWLAAVQAPSQLKTIVVAGSVPDFYRAVTTPQNAMLTTGGGWYAAYTSGLGIAPPAGAWVPEIVAWTEHRRSDACAEAPNVATAPFVSQARDTRDRAFFEARRPAIHAGNITAATWAIHGFDEARAHTFQADPLWVRFPDTTPKRFTLGQWDHTIQFDEHLVTHPDGEHLTQQLIDWFDHWLKGKGDTPRIGIVDHATGPGDWTTSYAWPPDDTTSNILHLTDQGLSHSSTNGETSFLAAPVGERAPACDGTRITGLPTSLSYMGAAANDTLHLAGTPIVDIVLRSNLPGGTIAADLYIVASDYDCSNTEPGTAGRPVGLRHVASGAADLRFITDPYQGQDARTDTPLHVRLDLTSLSTRIQPDERLALGLTAKGWWTASSAYTPVLTIIEGGSDPSRLTLPILPPVT